MANRREFFRTATQAGGAAVLLQVPLAGYAAEGDEANARREAA